MSRPIRSNFGPLGYPEIKSLVRGLSQSEFAIVKEMLSGKPYCQNFWELGSRAGSIIFKTVFDVDGKPSTILAYPQMTHRAIQEGESPAQKYRLLEDQELQELNEINVTFATMSIDWRVAYRPLTAPENDRSRIESFRSPRVNVSKRPFRLFTIGKKKLNQNVGYGSIEKLKEGVERVRQLPA